jgi:hypothetical protein
MVRVCLLRISDRRGFIPQADMEIAQSAPTFAMPTMSENGVGASVNQMSIFG